MNSSGAHCPLRQEDHYWLDTCAGSTSLHYYAAVDTGLTKRNLSSICLSGGAESGTAGVAASGRGGERERRSSKLADAHNPLLPPPPHLHPQVHSPFLPRTSKRRDRSEGDRSAGWHIVSSSIVSCIQKKDVLFISATFRFFAPRRRLLIFFEGRNLKFSWKTFDCKKKKKKKG